MGALALRVSAENEVLGPWSSSYAHQSMVLTTGGAVTVEQTLTAYAVGKIRAARHGAR